MESRHCLKKAGFMQRDTIEIFRMLCCQQTGNQGLLTHRVFFFIVELNAREYYISLSHRCDRQ